MASSETKSQAWSCEGVSLASTARLDSRLARWLALTAFAVLIAGWFAAALHLTGASAGQPGFPFNLRSNLAADYGADPGAGRITSLRISIIADWLKDLGFGEDDSELLAGLDSPVPTATARNFEGDPPFTATMTPSPTQTNTPLPTSTSTPKPPTKTPKPTDTEVPEPTELPDDSIAPSISGGSFFPTFGTLLPLCDGNDIAITGLRVEDPGPSSGFGLELPDNGWVKLKYEILGPGSTGYVYSADLGPPLTGGWTDGPGSSWDAYYKGTLTIDFSDGYAFTAGGKLFFRPPLSGPTETPTPEPFTVKVWSIVQDNAGNESYVLHGTYTLDSACGG